MADGLTICALFVVFASLYLTSEYWTRVLERWVSSRLLRCGVVFSVVHTLYVLILLWDGQILARDALGWQDIMLAFADSPIIGLNAVLQFDRYLKFTRLLWVFYVLIAGGLQWFLIGVVYGVLRGRWSSEERQGLNRERSAT